MKLDADRPLLLGSASPRRREMIAWLGVPFVVHPADVDESVRAGEPPDAYLARIVEAKLAAVDGRVPGAGAALVADTTVVAPGGEILGKPGDDGEAADMILRLSGATHEVSTRFAIRPAGEPGREVARTVTTRVTFRPVTPAEARAYAATGEGRDKAGAYAVQGRASMFIERLEGSYTAVVGLPLCELSLALRDLGWAPPP